MAMEVELELVELRRAVAQGFTHLTGAATTLGSRVGELAGTVALLNDTALRIADALDELVGQGEERIRLLKDSNEAALHFELSMREGQRALVSAFHAHDMELSRMGGELRDHADASRSLQQTMERLLPEDVPQC